MHRIACIQCGLADYAYWQSLSAVLSSWRKESRTPVLTKLLVLPHSNVAPTSIGLTLALDTARTHNGVAGIWRRLQRVGCARPRVRPKHGVRRRDAQTRG